VPPTTAGPGDPGTGPDEPAPDAGAAPEVTPLLVPADGVPEVVTTAAGLAGVAAAIAAGTGPVALDAERASGFRYSGRAYLVQLRRAGAGSFLVDPVPTAGDMAPLAAALDGPEWVLHAASQDLPCLAELGLRPRSLFDTELAGRLAGFERVGLGPIVERVLGLGLVKGHGAADWSTRPLPAD
jgi:ribonuclease D